MALEKKLGKIGAVGRFRPLHLGSATLLEELCEQAERVVIGIGSCNKYNARNPFTAKETMEMIDLYLRQRFSNYEFVNIPDYGHIPEFSDGRKWAEEVVNAYGELDAFVSGNDYVKELLSPHYEVIRSVDMIPKERWVRASGTMVRMAMATGEDWKQLVPAVAADYLESNGLVERFRREFGLQTLAQLADESAYRRDAEAEKLHVVTAE